LTFDALQQHCIANLKLSVLGATEALIIQTGVRAGAAICQQLVGTQATQKRIDAVSIWLQYEKNKWMQNRFDRTISGLHIEGASLIEVVRTTRSSASCFRVIGGITFFASIKMN
jgi:hypothetical protein